MRERAMGFTMVEMMIVLVILAILAAVAAPSMGAAIRTQRVKTASFNVFSSLLLARSEAVKRNTSVTITPSGGNWANGWTVADANSNTLRNAAGVSNITISGPASVTYSGNGRLSPVGTAVQFSLSASDVLTMNQRCIKVTSSGSPISNEGPCS
jgi:type IV fimbrial biogenesis protein FimT